MGIQIVISFILPLLTEYYPKSTFTKYFFMLSVGTLQLTEGGHFVLIPTILAKLFGPPGGVRVFSVGFAFVGLGSLINFSIITFFSDSLGYEGIIYLLGSATLASFIYLNCFYREERVKISALEQQLN